MFKAPPLTACVHVGVGPKSPVFADSKSQLALSVYFVYVVLSVCYIAGLNCTEIQVGYKS